MRIDRLEVRYRQQAVGTLALTADRRIAFEYMTYSNTYYGEHTTMVNGNGINPGMDDIIKVGTAAGLKKCWCEETAGRMKEMIGEQLREYLGGGKKI